MMEVCSTIACFLIQELRILEDIPTLKQSLRGRFTESTLMEEDSVTIMEEEVVCIIN